MRRRRPSSKTASDIPVVGAKFAGPAIPVSWNAWPDGSEALVRITARSKVMNRLACIPNPVCGSSSAKLLGTW